MGQRQLLDTQHGLIPVLCTFCRHARDRSSWWLPHSLEYTGGDEFISTQRHDNLRLGGTVPQSNGCGVQETELLPAKLL